MPPTLTSISSARRVCAALVTLLLALCVACSSAVDTSRVLPESPEHARELREDGYLWSNSDIRRLYRARADAIAELDAAWVEEGLPARERARRAYEVRHNARLTAREMMMDPREVEALKARDLEKYGHEDGPTFEWLVEKARAEGLEGDAIYESIIESAQRTR